MALSGYHFQPQYYSRSRLRSTVPTAQNGSLEMLLVDTRSGVTGSLGVRSPKAMAESGGLCIGAESYGWGIDAEKLWVTWVLGVCDA